jgi:import inner membrane translocase subunit TIM10
MIANPIGGWRTAHIGDSGGDQDTRASSMNFGGMAGAAAPAQPAQPSQFLMAKIEMLSRVCFQKCKFKYNDGQLNVGEMSCIDRCSGKYMQAYQSLGVKMAEVEKDIMAQANAAGGVQ